MCFSFSKYKIKLPYEIHPVKMYMVIASFLIYSFAYHAHIKYVSITNSSNYPKMVASLFGPITLASCSSLLCPTFSFFFYSISILYSCATLFKPQLYRLYHKVLNCHRNIFSLILLCQI